MRSFLSGLMLCLLALPGLAQGVRIDTLPSERDYLRGTAFQDLSEALWLAVGAGPADPIDSIAAARTQWVRYDTQSLGPGVHWLRLRLRQDSLPRRRQVVLTQRPTDKFFFGVVAGRWESRQAYVRGASGWETFAPDTTGLARAHQRDAALWPISLPPKAVTEVYLRLEAAPGSGREPVSLIRIDYEEEMAAEARSQMRLGLFWGIIWLQAAYFLLFWFTTRQQDYLYYLLYIGGIASLLLVYQFGQHWENWENFAYLIALNFSAFGALRFTAGFLDMARLAPKGWRWLRRFFGLQAGLASGVGLGYGLLQLGPSLSFLFMGISLVGLVFTLLFALFLLPGLTWRLYRRGNSLAGYLLVAWVCLLLGILTPVGMLLSSSLGVELERVDGTLLLAIILGGIILQMSTIALGLGRKQRMLAEDKLAAEQQLNQQLQAANAATRRFVPYEFLQAIGKERVQDVQLGDSAEHQLTVLFSDIRGYTTLSEQMTPRETFEFINAYLGAVSPPLRTHGGFVNQYLGDGIMGLFLRAPEDAIKAAIGMQMALDQFNARRSVPVRIGIGLHTGTLMMGIIGDGQRLDAAVVADAVNTAARMEGLTKYYGASLLISEAVYAQLPDPGAFAHRFLARVRVKGRQQPLAVYDVFAADPAGVRAQKAATQADFDRGVTAYYARDFGAAQTAFEAVLATYPEDLAPQRYLRYLAHIEQEGLPPDWDGVEDMLAK